MIINAITRGLLSLYLDYIEILQIGNVKFGDDNDILSLCLLSIYFKLSKIIFNKHRDSMIE